MKKRLLSLAMALCMVLSLLPATAFADENEETPVCTCEEACTAETINAECAVCGAEGASVENCCKYVAPAQEESIEETTPPEAPVCVCEDACTAEGMNAECPVCSAEGASVEDCCKYVAPEQEESIGASTPPEAPVCVCEDACTADAMDAECPVCGAEGAIVENCGKYIAPVVEEQMEEAIQLEAPAAEESEQTAVEKVQAMIDALPTVEELEKADDETVDEVYAAVQDICDALDELGTEELDQITGLDKLAALMEWFTGPVSTYEEDYSYLRFDNTTGTIIGLYDTSMTKVIIPASIDGVAVTSIDDYAFANCTSLTSITIQNGVTSIGAHAFDCCTSLPSITIPNSVESIDVLAFASCTSLTSITIQNGVTSIGSNAFENCSSLPSITIPNSVTSIGSGAFFHCDRLTSIFLPKDLSVETEDIPDATSQVRYSLDPIKNDIKITSIELGTDKTGVAIPATICGYDVVAISDDSLLTEISSHTCAGGEATCQKKAICGICKQEYGDYADHTLTKTEAKDATCTEDGNAAYWTCSVCHKLFSDEEGTNETTLDAVTIKVAHTLTKTEAKDATCTEDGNTAYWTCSVCNKYFSDENGTNEIAENSWVIKAAHKLTKTEAKGATCTEDGNTAYWTCSVCHKLFSDEDGTNETTLDAVTIKAGHTLTKTEAKVATVTETGNIEYWLCKDCGKYFADENGTNEITLDDTVIAKLPPEIIEGKGQSITAGEKKELTFRSNAAFSDFIRVELDGKTLGEKNYTAKEGSTVVTLDADYVSTLSAGEHTIGIVSESGTASTTFTVNAKAGSTDSSQTGTNSTNSPQTGDNSPLALWIALLFVSGGLLTVIGIYGKKKKYNR